MQPKNKKRRLPPSPPPPTTTDAKPRGCRHCAESRHHRSRHLHPGAHWPGKKRGAMTTSTHQHPNTNSARAPSQKKETKTMIKIKSMHSPLPPKATIQLANNRLIFIFLSPYKINSLQIAYLYFIFSRLQFITSRRGDPLYKKRQQWSLF